MRQFAGGIGDAIREVMKIISAKPKMKTQLFVGQKLIERNFGRSQEEHDNAVAANRALLYSALPPSALTVTRVSRSHVWITDDSGFTRRVSRKILEGGLMHGHTVKCTTWLSGPFEVVDDMTPGRDAQWSSTRRSRDEFASLRFDLAQASIGLVEKD